MAARATRSQALSLVTQANQASGSSQGASTQNARSRAQAGSSTQGPSSQVTQQTEIDFATYGPFHKAILGVFIAQSILDARQVRRMFQQTCAACTVPFPEDPKDYMTSVAVTMGVINARIRKYHLVLKKVCAETSIDSYYCLVNQSSHIIHQQQEVFKPAELEYLMGLTKDIAESGSGSISKHDAGDVTITASKLTQTNVEEYLAKFDQQRFVVQDEKKGTVMLGPRAVAELEAVLRKNREGPMNKCTFCQGIMTGQGIKCEGCKQRCHPICLVRLIDPEPVANFELPCSQCQRPFMREQIDKYRAMGKKKCEQLSADREEEADRQARAEEIELGDRPKQSASSRRESVADSTMEYE